MDQKRRTAGFMPALQSGDKFIAGHANGCLQRLQQRDFRQNSDQTGDRKQPGRVLKRKAGGWSACEILQKNMIVEQLDFRLKSL